MLYVSLFLSLFLFVYFDLAHPLSFALNCLCIFDKNALDDLSFIFHSRACVRPVVVQQDADDEVIDVAS